MKQFGAALLGVALLASAACANGQAKIDPVKIEAKSVSISRTTKDHLKIVADSIVLDVDNMPSANVDTKAKHQHIDFADDGTARSITLDGDAYYTVHRQGVAVLMIEADNIVIHFGMPMAMGAGSGDTSADATQIAPAQVNPAPAAPAPAPPAGGDNTATTGPTHTSTPAHSEPARNA